jgi:uncharacterized protein HemY
VWKITALRILSITGLGILLFLFLLMMFGRIEGRYIRRRKHRAAKENKNTHIIISVIYILSLFTTVLLCFYIIEQGIGGTM